jgi:pimeloyl-ACP methyl ester carboxylesterase
MLWNKNDGVQSIPDGKGLFPMALSDNDRVLLSRNGDWAFLNPAVDVKDPRRMEKVDAKDALVALGSSPGGIGFKAMNNNGVLLVNGNFTAPDSRTAKAAVLLPAELAVDANRDGTIVMGNDKDNPENVGLPIDKTTQDKPFRFWINADDDGEVISADGQQIPLETEQVPATASDYGRHKIVSKRNLEDFTRIWVYIGGLQDAIVAGNIQVGLKWQAGYTGTPAINIYASADTQGSDGYLVSDAAAQAQLAGNFGNAIKDKNNKLTVDANGTFIIPSGFWTGLSSSNRKKCLLFEGAGKGKGQLVLVFLDQNGHEIGQGPGIWIDLMSIKEMYLRSVASPQPAYPYNSTNGQPPAPSIKSSLDSTGGAFVPDPNEDTSNPTCVIFVHGFNMDYAHSTNYAETFFKRLWQRGYKGRFASFRWPTYGSGGDLGAVGTYNDSEYVAWSSGTALKQFVGGLSGYAIDIVAHSMGNIVVGEALCEGMAVSHFAMLHAASSASCYDNATSSYPIANNYRTPDTDSDSFTKSLGYVGHLGGIGGGIVNFYDEQDTAIVDAWNYNNSHFKPQALLLGLSGYYGYDSEQPSGKKLWLSAGLIPPLRYVTNSSEAKAYVDQSLTGSVGSNRASKGAIPENSIPEDVFGDSHSYEWDHPLSDQNTINFYNSLMGVQALNLSPIPMP